MSALSPDEYRHYARHFNLPDFGVERQLQLKAARVLVVGAGGLGSPLLLYLAAAGVGHIGIIDPDVIDISNLQRQVLYGYDQLGQSKVLEASKRLKNLNPHISIQTYVDQLSVDNALDIISQYDVVADGTDNFPTRYLVNDACVLSGVPNVYASIYQYEGQVSVFNYLDGNGHPGPNYRDLFPVPPSPGLVPDCATGGVLGVLAGIIGNMQALEVIKVITGVGRPLAGKLLIYDSLTSTSRIISFRKNSSVEILELINYEDFCGVTPTNKQNTDMQEITVQQLKEWKDNGKDFQLVDVREQNEIEFVNIGGDHIPLGDIMSRSEEISTDKDVVLMCRSGQRSGAALMALQREDKGNLYNLQGGILAWARDIDTSLPSY